MKKYIFIVCVLAVIFIASPAFTQAAALSQSQIDAIVLLLQSFGADQTAISNVQTSLSGGTPVATATTATSTTTAATASAEEMVEVPTIQTFNKDLKYGMRNNFQVADLQEILAELGHYKGSISGNYFVLTLQAVKKFQKANGISPSGYFGPATRAIANKFLKEMVGEGTILSESISEVKVPDTTVTPVISGPSLTIGPNNLIYGQNYIFTAQLKNATPNSGILFYLQRPDGTMKYENYSIGKTDSSGYFAGDTSQKIVGGQIGIYSAWAIVNNQKSNPVYFNLASNIESGGLKIAKTTYIKSVYSPGEKMAISIKGIESDGTLATSGEGFNVQAYIYDSGRTKQYDGVNGAYNVSTGLWDIALTAPTDTTKQYDLDIALYCASEGLACAKKYTAGNNQVNAVFKFQIGETTSFVSVVSPNGGEEIDYNSSGYQITWKMSSDISKVSIALYKNDASYKWIATDLPASNGSYNWVSSTTISSSETGGNFKIYMIGHKSTGGTVEDKSDGAFSVTVKGAPTITYFYANPSAVITEGKPVAVTLYWSSVNTTSCSIDSIVAPVSGSMGMSVSSTRTFLLGCIGSNGKTAASTTVTSSLSATPITVTSPNGGEIWQLKNDHTIKWTPYDPNTGVNPSSSVSAYLEKKDDYGNFMTVGKIVEGGKASIHWEGNLDSYGNYAQPGAYYVRVVNNSTGQSDRSDSFFKLVEYGTIKADVKINGSDSAQTVPSGGADWNVSWTSSDADYCRIYNGTTSTEIQVGTSGSQSMRFEWMKNVLESSLNIYCVSSGGIGKIEGSSGDYIPLKFASATTTPSITISGSSGSQTNSSALTVDIGNTFTISGVPQNLQGLSYYFGSGYPTAGYYNRAFFFDQTFGNNNSCGNNEASVNGSWTMTCTAKVAGSSNFYVEIYTNGQIYKSNIVTVTIPSTTTAPSITVTSPNGGETWPIGSTQIITWKSSGLEQVSINLLSADPTNEGSYRVARLVSNYSASIGSYSWVIPEKTECLSLPCITLAEHRNHKIEVVDARYGRDSVVSKKYSDESDTPFSIVAAGTLSVDLKINGSDTPLAVVYDSKISVSWVSNGASKCVSIGHLVPVEGGQPWGDPIAYNLPLPSGTWTLYARHATFGYISPLEIGIQCYNSSGQFVTDKINLIVNPTPSITVTSPNGGEQWYPGETKRITWNSDLNKVDVVEIYIYDSNISGSGSTVGIAYGTGTTNSKIINQGYYDWTIPSLDKLPGGLGSKNYRIRVNDDLTTSISDFSDTPFSIVATTTTPSITVLSPNGGETLLAGSNVLISYNAYIPAPATVKAYLRDSITGNETLITTVGPLSSAISGQSSISWTVPTSGIYLSSTRYLIKICDAGGSGICDSSNASFSIVAATTASVSSSNTANILDAINKLIESFSK